MADKLIIVESPAKANTIKKFLGGNVKVVASMGHIRDLPKSKIGIDVKNNFEPEYINIRGKGDLIKSLKKDAKTAKKVYLATDPDREGEAIAWHLAKVLDVDNNKITRVTFNEIKKTAVQKAIKEPRQIDKNLVNAQQARRVLDRIVGYKISPVLIEKETLKEVGISYPIKLEYYKDIHSDEFIRSNRAKYGISVVKTSYIPNNTVIENKDVEYLSNDERKIEKILEIFKENEVTPVGVEDVLNELKVKMF